MAFPRSGRVFEDLSPELFDQLLAFLLQKKGRTRLTAAEREQAGCRYEDIRRRVIRMFICRGVASIQEEGVTPEDLTDETVTRVAYKVPEIASSYVGDPVLYFCGVARRVYWEAVRKRPEPKPLPPRDAPAEEDDTAYECLESCMERLTPRNREIVLDYYRGVRGEKIRNRRRLANTLGVDLNALRIRIHRIRKNLQACVSDCLRMNNTG